MLKHFLKNFAVILLSLFLLVNNCWAGIDFDGVDDVINCGSGASLDNLSAITISMWIYPDNVTATTRVFVQKRSGSTSPGWKWGPSSSGTGVISFFVNLYSGSPNNLNVPTATNTLSANVWQHFIITWDGSSSASNVHIYKNGSEVTYGTTTSPSGTRPDDNSESLVIGANNLNGNPFPGLISEVAIWNVVLTAGEIAQLANSRLKNMPLQIQPSALKLYVPIDDQPDASSADGDIVRDLSSNGNNGTGDNGANNTGLTWAAETILSYPSPILQGQ